MQNLKMTKKCKEPRSPKQKTPDLKHIKNLGQANQIISGSIQATAEDF